MCGSVRSTKGVPSEPACFIVWGYRQGLGIEVEVQALRSPTDLAGMAF